MTEFSKKKTGRYGVSGRCKACDRVYLAAYFTANKEALKQSRKEYYAKNKEVCKERVKIYRQNNPELLKERDRKKYYSNKPAINAKNREKYRLKNGPVREPNEKYRKNNRFNFNLYNKERKATDVQYNLSVKLRTRLTNITKGKKKSAAMLNLLGCDLDLFRLHFERKFTKGMTWEKFLNGEIHIDHRIPIASFDLGDPEQQRICFHYTNLQPLWAIDNLRKSNKILEPVQLHVPL